MRHAVTDCITVRYTLFSNNFYSRCPRDGFDLLVATHQGTVYSVTASPWALIKRMVAPLPHTDAACPQ